MLQDHFDVEFLALYVQIVGLICLNLCLNRAYMFEQMFKQIVGLICLNICLNRDDWAASSMEQARNGKSAIR